MAKRFADLVAKMSPEAQARVKKKHKQLLSEMPLYELRQARGISQVKLAEALKIKQPNVARLEKRMDIYVSTLRNAIEAMGGTLDIVARFPEGSVKIANFSSIDEGETPAGES